MITKIYVLCEPDGEIRYIGKTVQSLHKRLAVHLCESRNGKLTHKCNWMRSLLSKGYLPSIQLIGEVYGDGCREEIAWIKYFREEGIKLVNGTDGGEGVLGHKLSDEIKLKLRRTWFKKGQPSLMKGKHHSIETRIKLSNAGKGKPGYWMGKQRSMETCIKISKTKRGKHHSVETRQKISEAVKGEKNHWFGKHHSAETRKKISEAKKRKNEG